MSVLTTQPAVIEWQSIISLHICSMWETICDAWACWSGWNFGPNSTEYPYSEIQFQNTPPPRKWKLSEILALWLFSFRIPPPPKIKIVRDLGTLTFQFQNTPPQNENCQRSWHFDFSVSEYPPPRKWKLSEILALWLFSFRIPPRKWKLSEILALWLFSFRIPPPENENCQRSWHFDFSVSGYPPQNENCQRSWHFDFSVSEYPPQNENCQRSWHFDFSVSEYPPQKWKLSEILALWLLSFRIPTPREKFKFGQILPLQDFQFQNYVWQVTTYGDFIQPG